MEYCIVNGFEARGTLLGVVPRILRLMCEQLYILAIVHKAAAAKIAYDSKINILLLLLLLIGLKKFCRVAVFGKFCRVAALGQKHQCRRSRARLCH